MTTSLKELIEQLSHPVWEMGAANGQNMVKKGTLQEIATHAHVKTKKNEAIGPIRNVENNVEIGMLELEQLWEHLGLPH